MRKVLLSISFVLLVFAVPAQAALDSSHHDLPNYLASTAVQNCFNCHGIVSKTTTSVTGAGAVGTFCLLRCHISGVGLVSTTEVAPRAPSYWDNTGTFITPAATDFNIVRFDRSHGSAMSAINPGGGFPYSPAAATTGDIECTSCHAVHDNKQSPFVWRPLMTQAAAGGGLCDSCHTPYSDLSGSTWATIAPTGNHPINFQVSTAAALARTSTVTSVFGNTRKGRRINIDDFGGSRVFDVSTTSGTNLTGQAAHWTTGGHMFKSSDNTYSNFTTADSVMGCATCHAVHFPNTAANSGINNLTVMQFNKVDTGWNPLCMGCHGGTTTWATNQYDCTVGSTGFDHPVGAGTAPVGGVYTVSTGQFTFAINGSRPAVMTFGAGGQIMCSSCHYVHRPGASKSTVAGSMLILNTGTAQGTICKDCHNGVGLPDVQDKTAGGASGETANAHHRTRVAFSAGSIAPAGGGTELNMQIKNPSWVNAATKQGDFSTGMDCADCHVYGTAHNW